MWGWVEQRLFTNLVLIVLYFSLLHSDLNVLIPDPKNLLSLNISIAVKKCALWWLSLKEFIGTLIKWFFKLLFKLNMVTIIKKTKINEIVL